MQTHTITIDIHPGRMQRLRAKLPAEYRHVTDEAVLLAYARAVLFSGGEGLTSVAVGCLQAEIEAGEAVR
jgi:hypothetical protein